MICNHCNSENTTYTVKLVATNRQDQFYPKYIPQIKATCTDCGKYIKFVSQTPELIEKVNKHLETSVFIDGFVSRHKDKTQQEFQNWLNK
jgi:pimeloyl-CoA synthetase